jgi:serine/threonine protein kinase
LLISHKNSFKYLNPIGKGGFGSVVKARHLLDNNIYAIKKIKLHLGTDQDIKNHKVFREVQAMTIVNHVNVSYPRSEHDLV